MDMAQDTSDRKTTNHTQIDQQISVILYYNKKQF